MSLTGQVKLDPEGRQTLFYIYEELPHHSVSTGEQNNSGAHELLIFQNLFSQLRLRNTSNTSKSINFECLDVCIEWWNYTFCASTWLGALQQSLQNFWRLISACLMITKSWLNLSWFYYHKGIKIWCGRDMNPSCGHRDLCLGVGTNCPNIKDEWATTFWVE